MHAVAAAQCDVEEDQKLEDPGGSRDALLGYTLGAHGDALAAGAPQADGRVQPGKGGGSALGRVEGGVRAVSPARHRAGRDRVAVDVPGALQEQPEGFETVRAHGPGTVTEQRDDARRIRQCAAGGQ